MLIHACASSASFATVEADSRRCGQRGAQVDDELVDEPRGAERVRRVDALDGGERVEQELRLDARLHRLESRFLRAAHELRAVELACVEAGEALRRAAAIAVAGGDESADEETVGQHVGRPRAGRPIIHAARARGETEERRGGGEQDLPEDRGGDRRDRVRCDRVLVVARVGIGHAQYRRRAEASEAGRRRSGAPRSSRRSPWRVRASSRARSRAPTRAQIRRRSRSEPAESRGARWRRSALRR